MMEYAATHGFRVVFPYAMADTAHFPVGTGWLRWGSFVDWRRYCADRNLPWGRYGLPAERDVVQELLDSTDVWASQPGWIAMLDLEHGGPLPPEELRREEWYPAAATEAERQAFEPILRQGEVKVDVPALDQSAQTLPIVRRVKLGRYQLLATYDPLCVQGGAPREIGLDDFDGHTGLRLVLLADAQVRVFALQEE